MNSESQHTKTTVYQAQDSLSLRKIFIELLIDIKPARELGLQLAKRDIKAAYRQSLLGILWAFIPPLMNSLIWIVLNSSKTVTIQKTPIPYPAFVLIGTLMWQVLTESVNQPLRSVKSGKSILAKLNFPRESLLFHGFFTLLFNTLLKLTIIVAVLLVFKINPGWQGLGFIPMLIGLMITGFSIGMLVLPVGMMYGDISRMIPLAMQFLMLLTPVVFPMPESGKLLMFNQVNPFSYLIETTRNLLTAQAIPYLVPTLSILGVAFVFLIIAVIVYRFIMPIIIERVGA